ncbi:hypothetical protein NST99_21395 [Paenibacillus sp. FSL L8-0470]|uniref:hypothetical protein n=1 Tax=unclassified Paenibacillus TaxID=185978 RepID=UPI0030FA0C11
MNKRIAILWVTIILMFVIAGCNSNKSSVSREWSTSNPTAEDVLSDNSNANIFMFSDIIYNSGIPWVDELELHKDQYVTEIIEQSGDGKEFKNGTANQLSIGTKIYSVKERSDIYIAETEDGDLRFYGLVEG